VLTNGKGSEAFNDSPPVDTIQPSQSRNMTRSDVKVIFLRFGTDSAWDSAGRAV